MDRRRLIGLCALLLPALAQCSRPEPKGPPRGLENGHLSSTLPPYAFDVHVRLTPHAAQQLAARHETIVVSRLYFGFPTAATQGKADDMGEISFGESHAEYPPLAEQTVHIADKAIDAAGLRDIGGKPYLNINVSSARKSSPDNLLNCSIYEDAVPAVTSAPLDIHCDLIRP